MITKYKTGKHFEVTITDDHLTVSRSQAQIDEQAALDGLYVIRTPVPAGQLDAPGVVTAYQYLKYAGRDFRHIKADAGQPGSSAPPRRRIVSTFTQCATITRPPVT